MAREKFATPDVNFLPKDELEGRPGGSFLRWALTWGKRIVVLTELIVILAFLSRFWLDTQVADLSEKIDRQRGVVLASSEFEKKFRVLSARVEKAQAIENLRSPLVVYNTALKIIPASVTVSRIMVDNHSVSMAGGGSDQAIVDIVSAFRESSEFSDVNVERISKTDLSPNVTFSLQATFVGKGGE